MESPAPTELTTVPLGASLMMTSPDSGTRTAPSPAMDISTLRAPFSCSLRA